MKLRKVRIFSQIFFFLLFLVQVFCGILISNELVSANPLSSIFFYMDPLLLIHSLFTGFLIIFLISIPFLLLSLIFRRYFCGWICPLGTLIRIFSRKGYGKFDLKFRKFKNFTLFAFIFLTLSGITFLFMDPITIVYRFFSSFLYPAIINIFLKSFNFFGISPPDFFLRIFPSKEVFIFHSLSIFLFLFFILLLNYFEKNFWCKYICPLGALFSIFSSVKCGLYLEKDIEKCINCGKCQLHCSMDVNPICGKEWEHFDCILCMNCVNVCPTDAIKFKYRWRFSSKEYFDVEKRKTLNSLIGMGLSFYLIGGFLKYTNRIKNRVLRPPGALREEKFLEKCIRCGECVSVCPTNFLHPALFEASFDGIYTPIGVPQYGYCEDRCVRCSEVCPSGAIKGITISEKLSKPIRIGTAYIDKNRCIPWNEGKSCIVCEEVCPAIGGDKAIKLVVKDVNGKKVKVPEVSNKLCIGCSICENRCPQNPPAIFVTNDGEIRF